MEETSPLEKALDISTNRIISACAGAGKTYALSKRYCAILDEFTSSNMNKPKNELLGFKNILVITFTNKAAAEMSQRIYKDLQILLEGEEIEELKEQGICLGNHIKSAPHEYKNWLRSTFSQNHIMTIDSFCGSVLRENAYLLDIDPQFKTSDELLAQKLYRETLHEFLIKQSRRLRPELKEILKYTDKNGIIQFFNYFNNKKVFLEDWLEFIDQHSQDEIYQHWLDSYLPEFDVCHLIEEILKIIPYHEHIKQGEVNTLAEIKKKLNNIPEDTDQARRKYFMAEVLPYFITAKNEYYSAAHYIQSKKSFITTTHYKQYKHIAEEFLNELQQYIPENKVLYYPSQEDYKSIPVFKHLITLYADFEDVLWEVQLRKNYLTFNDVIIKTREMLAHNEVIRSKYSAQFKHILVDEFQDTNNLRWDIIKHIARKKDGKLRESGLFIVGDKKQSIYRFQQADVEVMNIAQDELEAVTPETLISFNDNYRSTKAYINHVINPLFNNIFTDPKFTFDATFKETTFPENRKADNVDSEITCDISVVEDDPHEQEYTSAIHAAHIAQKYLKWAEEQQIKEDVVVGVLLRNFIHITEYLHAFQKLDIPFQIIGERNLFNQQEAYDLFNFISIIINPHDDAALVGLLRSPFFSAPDTLIYQCKDWDQKTSIFSFMLREIDFNSIVETITYWRQLAQTLPVNRLLQKILTEAHREFGYVSETSSTQRLANLDKLLHLISKLELDGLSLQALHDYLDYQIRYKSEIAQADIPEPAKVQIMTIHKAKGLEFPAVILPELNATTTQTSKGNIYHSRIVPEGMVEVGISIKEQVESKKSNFLELIKRQDKIEQEAEDKRMLYVAVTRAKYRIALLAEYIGNYKKNSWWSSFVVKPLNLPRNPEELINDENNFPSKYNVSLLSSAELQDKLNCESLTEKRTTSWDPQEIPKYKYSYKLITPHDIMRSVASYEDASHRTDSQNMESLAFGSIFHVIMEQHWWDWDAYSNEIMEYITTHYSSISFDSLEAQLQKHLNNFTCSVLYQKLIKIEKEHIFHEHHITGWMDNDQNFYEVNGIIDLMFRTKEGWTIVDFKTDATAQRIEQYTFQIQTYLWIVQQLYGINAQAYIYYSSLNQLIEVHFSDDYWKQIFPQENTLFAPSKLHSFAINPELLRIIDKNSCTIINLTMYHTTQMLQTLAAKQVLTPYVEITTLDRLLTSSTYKLLTSDISRMLVKKAAEGYHLTDGTIDLLSQAFLLYNANERKFESDRKNFNDIYDKFEELRSNYHFHYESEILKTVISDSFSTRTMIINGFFSDESIKFSLMKNVASSAKQFYFIDSFKENSVTSSFDYSPQIWEMIEPDYSTPHPCTSYYSIETEIEGIAEKILDLCKKNISYDAIEVAIASIEVYIPVIEQVFSAYGIPYHIFAPSYIIDHPVATLISEILTIMLSSEHLTWQTLSSVLLHPLMQHDEELYRLDAFIRKSPCRYFSDVVELRGIETFREKVHTVCEDIAMLELHPEKESYEKIWSKLVSFLEAHNSDITKEYNKDLDSVYSKIENIITNTIEIYKLIGFPTSNDEILKELKHQFKDVQISRRKSAKGINIISYLDSYASKADVLFIAGLAEDYFPVPLKKNPFTKTLPHFEWQKSALLLNSWLARDEQTFLSYPCKNLNSDPLNPSILLEGIQIKKEQLSKSSHIKTLRQYYLSCEDKIIENPDIPVLQRHNDYLSENIGPYRGQVNTDKKSSLLISSSRINTLIQCPMQYLFRYVLDLKPLYYDEDTEIRLSLGNHIHKALEIFGKQGGFSLLKDNFQQACSMLNNQLQQVLQNNMVQLENDLFLQRLYYPYTNGLAEGDEQNLLVKLLLFNKEQLSAFSPILFEQNFGLHNNNDKDSWPVLIIRDDNVAIHFWGKIDKIMKDHDKNRIIGIDYKTGTVPYASELWNFWDVQPLIYFLVLQQQYTHDTINFLYESTKDVKENPLTITCSENMYHFITSRSKYVRSCEDIYQFLLHYGKKAMEGEFTIRDREANGKPCNYCDFYQLCRKNSISHKLITTDEILQFSTKEI